MLVQRNSKQPEIKKHKRTQIIPYLYLLLWSYKLIIKQIINSKLSNGKNSSFFYIYYFINKQKCIQIMLSFIESSIQAIISRYVELIFHITFIKNKRQRCGSCRINFFIFEQLRLAEQTMLINNTLVLLLKNSYYFNQRELFNPKKLLIPVKSQLFVIFSRVDFVTFILYLLSKINEYYIKLYTDQCIENISRNFQYKFYFLDKSTSLSFVLTTLTFFRKPVINRSQQLSLELYNMLGIESEISIQGQVSRLSISSNTSRLVKDNHNLLNKNSTLISQGAVPSNVSASQKIEKIKYLRNRMQQITRNQEAMDTRMKTYVTMIEKQVKKKQEQNRQLEDFINSLKKEITSTRSDIEYLTTILTKRIPSSPRQQQKSIRGYNVNQAKNQTLMDVRKQVQINIQKPPKSISPRNRVVIIDKSKNTSPISRQQKKPALLGTIPSPFHRKIRSPAK